MAVQTRRQNLQFEPETTSKQFAATDAPAAIQSSPEVFANLRDTSSSPAPRAKRSPSLPGLYEPRLPKPALKQSPSSKSPGTKPARGAAKDPNDVATTSNPVSSPPAGNASKAPSSRQRRPLRADGGDVCDETDSAAILNRRQTLQSPSPGATNRFAAALLRFPMTIALGHLFEFLHDADLVELVTRLGSILDTSLEQSARTSAFCVAATELLSTAALPEDERDLLFRALDGNMTLSPVPDTYAAALRTPAPWQEVPGTMATWKVDHSKIRRTVGTFLFSAQPADAAHRVDVVFDEGCEVCTFTRAALLRLFTDWSRGHPPFFNMKGIGAPRALYLQRALNLNGFHSTQASTPYLVLLHPRLQCAAYPVHCLVVEHAPGKIVLGLPFRRRYDVALPAKFRVPSAGTHRTAVGVTHACLGVPKGYGIQFPPALAARYVDKQPSETAYRQVLEFQPDWVSWQHTGKEITADSLRTYLGSNNST